MFRGKQSPNHKKLGSHVKLFKGRTLWYFYVDFEDLAKSTQFKEALKWADKNSEAILNRTQEKEQAVSS